MGNCITRKATLAELDDQLVSKRKEKTAAVAPITSTLQATKHDDRKKEKRVRFRQREEDINGEGETKTGVIRIKLVLTQKELAHILSDKNKHSSSEKLLRAINMRSKRISLSTRSNDGERYGNWKPSLESIPEDP